VSNRDRVGWPRQEAAWELKHAWLGEVYLHVGRSEHKEAIDRIYGEIDGLTELGDLKACDEVLRSVDLRRLSADEVVAFLVCTLPVSLRLSERDAFRARCRPILELEPAGADAILQGL